MQTHTIGGRIGICQTNKLNITSAENVEFDIDWHANAGVRLRRQGYSSVAVGSGTNYNDGDLIGVALDVDNSTVKFYKNGSLAYNIDFSSYITPGSKFLTAHSWGYFTSLGYTILGLDRLCTLLQVVTKHFARQISRPRRLPMVRISLKLFYGMVTAHHPAQ